MDKETVAIHFLTSVGILMTLFGPFINFLCHQAILRMPEQGTITRLFSHLAIFDTISLAHLGFNFMWLQLLSNFIDLSFLGHFGCSVIYYTMGIAVSTSMIRDGWKNWIIEIDLRTVYNFSVLKMWILNVFRYETNWVEFSVKLWVYSAFSLLKWAVYEQ